MTRLRILHALTLAGLLASSACGNDTHPLSLRGPDRTAFEQNVYPVLLRDCAFNACHGSSLRFFQVMGRGRGRLLSSTRALDPTTPDEIMYSYERASSMIDPVNPKNSLLLLKPLEAQAGGIGHQGVDRLGRDVYQTATDPNYVALTQWVLGSPPAHP